MAVAYDSIGPASAAPAQAINANSLSWSHPAFGAGSNYALVAYANCGDNTNLRSISGITYGGVSMVQVGAVSLTSAGRFSAHAMFKKAAPSSAGGTVAVTYSNTAQQLTGVSFAFTGADQTDPVPNGQFNNKTENARPQTTNTLTITAASGDMTTTNLMVITNPTLTSDQTRRYEDHVNANIGAYAGDTAVASGNVTHTWTAAADNDWLLIGGAVVQPSAADPSPQMPAWDQMVQSGGMVGRVYV